MIEIRECPRTLPCLLSNCRRVSDHVLSHVGKLYLKSQRFGVVDVAPLLLLMFYMSQAIVETLQVLR